MEYKCSDPGQNFLGDWISTWSFWWVGLGTLSSRIYNSGLSGGLDPEHYLSGSAILVFLVGWIRNII